MSSIDHISDSDNCVELPVNCENDTAAHVLLDARMRGSGLEGSVPSLMLGFFASFIESNPNDLSSTLVSQFTRCGDWAKGLEDGKLDVVVKDVVSYAQRLLPNASIVIPGGWIGDPFGHAMLYELTKTANDTYSLRVINTGAGLEHHIQIKGKKKTKHLLACSYTNIPREKLFYGKDGGDFFKTLLSFQTTQQKADFKPKVIYQGALALLNPYRNDTDLATYSSLFITPQRSGTCAFKAPKAYLRLVYCLAGKRTEEYKSLSENLREQTLRAFFKHAQRGSNSDEQTLCLLDEMGRELAHTFKKRHEKVPKSCSDLLRAVQNFVQINQPDQTFNRSSKPASYEQGSPLVAKRRSLLGLPPLNKSPIPLRLPLDGLSITGGKALPRAKHLLSKVKQCKDLPYILHHIDTFATQLSLNRSDWKNGASFNEIHQLLQTYHDYSVKQHKDASPRHLTTLLTLYYVLWAMLPYTEAQLNREAFTDINQVKNLIKTLTPPKDLFGNVDKDLFFLLMSKKEQKRFLEVREAFDNWEQPVTSRSVFESLLCQKMIPDPADPEMTYYKNYNTLLTGAFKERAFWQIYKRDVAKEYEEQAQLATKNHPWENSFPPFALLRGAHYLLAGLTHNAVVDPEGIYYRPTGANQLRIDKYEHPDFKGLQAFFQRAYGYRGNLSLFLQNAFTLPSLKTKKWWYTNTCEKATQEESNPLESKLDKTLDQETRAFLKQLASLMTEKALAPSHLLTLYTQHASLLQNLDHRTLFLTQLFKTFPSGKNGIEEAIAQSPTAIGDLACNFAETLETLAFHGGDNPDHELFLFSCQILSNLSQYYSTNQLPASLKKALQSQRDQMADQIASFKGKNDAKSQTLQRLYHLHYLYALTTFPATNIDHVAEVFGHYFALSSLPQPENNPYLFLEHDTAARVHAQLSLVAKKHKESLPHLITTIVAESGFDTVIGTHTLPSSIKIDKKSAAITFRDQENQLVELHCATGDIFHNGILFDRSGDFGKGTRSYHLLFGNKTYPVMKVGKTQYLQHPAGTFRKIKDQITFQFNNQGEWMIFCPADEMDKSLPLPFRVGYQHFYNPKKDQWTFVQNRHYGAFNTSQIWKTGEQKIYSHDRSSYSTSVRCSALEKIERSGCIFKKFYKNHQTHIEVPRFNLVLIVDGNKLRWQEDPNYFLIEDNLPQGTLCVQEELLSFQNKEGKQLVFSPRYQIEGVKGFSKKALFIKPEDEEGGSFDWSLPIPQVDYSCYAVSKNEDGELSLSFYRRRYPHSCLLPSP